MFSWFCERTIKPKPVSYSRYRVLFLALDGQTWTSNWILEMLIDVSDSQPGSCQIVICQKSILGASDTILSMLGCRFISQKGSKAATGFTTECKIRTVVVYGRHKVGYDCNLRNNLRCLQFGSGMNCQHLVALLKRTKNDVIPGFIVYICQMMFLQGIVPMSQQLYEKISTVN